MTALTKGADSTHLIPMVHVWTEMHAPESVCVGCGLLLCGRCLRYGLLIRNFA